MKISVQNFQNLINSALVGIGHRSRDAQIITNVLMYAELRDNNQGVIKLVTGGLNPNPKQTSHSKTVFETPVSARIDGGHQIGMVVLQDSVDIALKKCATTGIAIVGASGYASATGALGYWTKEITKNGKIGIVMSQCNEMVAPHGSYEAIYGTNPISFGIPRKASDSATHHSSSPLILDMATSAYAWYGIKIAEQEGKSIPSDIAYNNQGFPTTNPTEALKGAIRPFDLSYKGSHLGLMVELLAGAFTGASMDRKLENENWGSLVLAIDPIIMGNSEEFDSNINIMSNRVKNAKRLPEMKNKEIVLPGERGDKVAEKKLNEGYLEISDDILKKLEKLSNK
jgi:L-2-hydroxycarboxylate dehydrogenase (NAD+)